jgi:titin
MTFEWQPPDDKGGIELLEYRIYMAMADAEFSQVNAAPSELNPSITVHKEDGLTADQVYKFRVSAVNFVGEGPMSDEIYVIAADMPEKPDTLPEVTLVTQTSITLTLYDLPVQKNGGSPVTGYIVQMDDGLGGEFVTVHDSLYMDLILSGLESSRFYRIKYAARNIIFDSGNMFECDMLQFSEEIVVLTAVNPTSPRNL